MFCGIETDARRVLIDIASALAYLRRMKILHNDIKPANILYSRDQGAKLIDFGLATRDRWLVCTGGSPWYVPPEFMALEERRAPSDIWALGITMLYLINRIPLPDRQKQAKLWIISQVNTNKTGTAKGVETARDAMRKWLGHIGAEVRRLSSYNSALSQTVIKMLQAVPGKRISADDLVRESQRLHEMT